MKSTIALAALLGCASAAADSPSSAFDRGHSLQSWQDPGLGAVLAECANPPAPFAIGAGQAAADPPPAPALPPASEAIPGVIAAGATWRVVWAWEGNDVDGLIAGENGTVIFANNDASNVMRLDPETGLATVLYRDTNTGGAVSRSRNGALFVAARGLGTAIEQLEPERRVLADSFRGEPLECVGGVLNDLAADARGGVYFTVTGAGLFYANPQGVVSQYGEAVTLANGVILSPDERTLYVTNGPVVLAFDVEPDGTLNRQREFGRLRGGQSGDGSAVDAEGRVYVATGASADVFAPDGAFLGSIPGPQGMHGVAIGGPDKRTLFGIVFYGAWGTPSARNEIVAIPLLARGYAGRAK